MTNPSKEFPYKFLNYIIKLALFNWCVDINKTLTKYIII